MLINKIGYAHWEMGSNCQDAGGEFVHTTLGLPIKIVADGCSEGLHSEVGAKLFCKLCEKRPLMNAFDVAVEMFPSFEDKKNYLLFTYLWMTEDSSNFCVEVCGDGTIIKQTHDDKLEYQRFDFDGMPPYYVYNYMDKERLSKYKTGVIPQSFKFPKSDYKAIGIASDGIDYILNSIYKDEFEEYLIARKAVAIKRLINRQHKLFKDDITIVI